MIQFACPKCGLMLQCPDHAAGQAVACPTCQTVIRVPAPIAAPRSVPVALPPASSPAAHDGRQSKHSYWRLPAELPPIVPQEALRTQLPRNLPPEIAALGAPVNCFTRRVVPIIGIVVGLAMLLTGLGMMVAVGFVSFRYNWIGVPGFFILVGGIYVALRAWWDVGRKILLFREGLVCVGRGRPVLRRWEDVVAVFQDIQEVHDRGLQYFTHSYRVEYRDGDGQTFDDNSTSDARGLGHAILFETTRRLLPQYRQALAQGAVLSFGPLRLSREGLIGSRGPLRWEDLADVSLTEVVRGFGQRFYRSRTLRIEQQVMVRSVWAEVPLEAVPNPHVLLTLLGERVPAVWQ